MLQHFKGFFGVQIHPPIWFFLYFKISTKNMTNRYLAKYHLKLLSDDILWNSKLKYSPIKTCISSSASSFYGWCIDSYCLKWTIFHTLHITIGIAAPLKFCCIYLTFTSIRISIFSIHLLASLSKLVKSRVHPMVTTNDLYQIKPNMVLWYWCYYQVWPHSLHSLFCFHSPHCILSLSQFSLILSYALSPSSFPFNLCETLLILMDFLFGEECCHFHSWKYLLSHA